MVGGRKRGEVAQTIYTHVSKCKNEKIKEKKIFSYFVKADDLYPPLNLEIQLENTAVFP
jgi:hypothetical protein